jgi:hypothetical protein
MKLNDNTYEQIFFDLECYMWANEYKWACDTIDGATIMVDRTFGDDAMLYLVTHRGETYETDCMYDAARALECTLNYQLV